MIHREYNVHFLATSNIAPPLEMLDGILDQIEYVYVDFEVIMNIYNTKLLGKHRNLEVGLGTASSQLLSF